MLCLSYINVLNKPIKAKVLSLITAQLGPLPLLFLPPVIVVTRYILNPSWVMGFVCGEGSFTYFTATRVIAKGITNLTYTMVFETSQLPSDTFLLLAVLDCIGIGQLYSQYARVSRIRISNMRMIQHYVVPFFTLCPLIGHKAQQYHV